MFGLTRIGNDVLRSCLSYLEASDLGRLYGTGNNALMSLMRFNVTHINSSENDGKRLLSVMLKRHICIQNISLPQDVTVDDDCVQLFPDTLMHIELGRNNLISDVGFWNIFGLSSLTSLDIGSNEQISVAAYCLPPSLTRVSICNVESRKYEFAFLLPPQLVWLDIFCRSRVHPDSISELPTSLTHLCIKAEVGLQCSNDGLTLLTSLKYLKLDFNDDIVSTGCLQSVPKSLTHLELPSDERLNDRDLVKLPPSVTILILNSNTSISSAGLRLLPPNLTKLHLGGNRNPIDWDLVYLPRSILSLRMMLAWRITNLGICLLPPSLTELVLSEAVITGSGIAQMPQTLMHLNLEFHPDITNECLVHLSPQLTYLNLNLADMISDNGIPHLPRSLTWLGLSHARELTDYAVPHLPPGLTYLDLARNGNITSDGRSKMPPTLTTLRLGTAVATIYDYEALPRRKCCVIV